jgi:uroporphyrinogen-III synthase
MGFNYISPDESKVVKLIQDIKEGNIHAITFTSPPAVRDFFQIAEHYSETLSLQLYLNTRVIVAAIGPSTKKAIEGNMVLVDVMPTVYKMGSMVKSLSDFMSKSNESNIKTKSTLEEKE